MTELSGLHAIAYARVSTDDKGQTTATQFNAIRQWADDRGVIIDAEYSDELSGATWPRPGLATACAIARATSASMLICYDQSRLTRNAAEHMPLIADLLGEGRVIRYVVNGDLNPEDLGAKMMSAIKSVTDSEERAKLSERTRLGMQTRINAGIHCGRPARFMWAEDVPTAPKGKIKRTADEKGPATVIISHAQMMDYATRGWSVNFVAKAILRVNTATLHSAMVSAGLLDQYKAILKKC